MTLTIDQACMRQSLAGFFAQHGGGLMDSFARESALSNQLGSGFSNGGDKVDMQSSTARQSPPGIPGIQFPAEQPASHLDLLAHVGRGRAALSRLRERERRREQRRTDELALAWLAKNRATYAGRWIAVRGCELLASGMNAQEVYARARGQQPAPLVVKIESEGLPFAGW